MSNMVNGVDTAVLRLKSDKSCYNTCMDLSYVQREISKNVLSSQMLLFMEGFTPSTYSQIKLSENEYWRLYGFIMHSIIGSRPDSPLKQDRRTAAQTLVPYMTTDYEITVEDNKVRTFYNLDN